MGECPRANSWFRSCRFEARYETLADAKFVTPEIVAALSEGMVFADEINTAIRTLTKSEVYVRDVCVLCGRSIERAALADPPA